MYVQFTSCFYGLFQNTKNDFPNCVKSAHIQSYSGPNLIRMQENTNQGNFKYGYFSRSVKVSDFCLKTPVWNVIKSCHSEKMKSYSRKK